jgi:phospholipase C
VNPYARPHDVTNVVHDDTSVLATIEHQWNLPALTYRDANATTLVDFSQRRANVLPRAALTGCPG